MADYVLIDGDQAIYQPTFGAATVVVQPGKLVGSGPAALGGKPVCVEGDEKSAKVENCPYVAPPFVGGTGTLEIVSLAGDQIASKTKTGSTKTLLVGSSFTAKFTVQVKGTDPSSGSPDPLSEYPGGSGSFVTTNTKFRGV